MQSEQAKDVYILGIESSCDETAAAVVINGRKVCSNVIASQIEIHKRFGGVVPEIASRNHTLSIEHVVDEALRQAQVTLSQIQGIAVTYGAGLQGALLVGLTYAKGLAYAANLPLIGVNHIRGHIAANYITHPQLEPPFIALVVSGGHTEIVCVRNYNEVELLGRTKDDAVGEAFDKVARACALPYPGGPHIDALAKTGKNCIPMPQMLKQEDSLDFSYSGLKTAVINYLHNHKAEEISLADVACSFQHAALDVLVEKSMEACRRTGIDKLSAAGGVSANSYLRAQLQQAGAAAGVSVFLPQPILCTDNAAMIAAEGYYRYRNGDISDLQLNVAPSLRLCTKGGNQ